MAKETLLKFSPGQSFNTKFCVHVTSEVRLVKKVSGFTVDSFMRQVAYYAFSLILLSYDLCCCDASIIKTIDATYDRTDQLLLFEFDIELANEGATVPGIRTIGIDFDLGGGLGPFAFTSALIGPPGSLIRDVDNDGLDNLVVDLGKTKTGTIAFNLLFTDIDTDMIHNAADRRVDFQLNRDSSNKNFSIPFDGFAEVEVFNNFTTAIEGDISPASVPEPGSIAFLSLIGLLAVKRRRVQRSVQETAIM